MPQVALAAINTRAKPSKRKARRKAKAKAKPMVKKTAGKHKGNGVCHSDSKSNGNGFQGMTSAELKVICADLTVQNAKLTTAIADAHNQLRKIHEYLDALHAPGSPNDMEVETLTAPARAVEAVKLWFRKRGGVESSDHVSSTLRAMMLAAGEWRCIYPDAGRVAPPEL